MARQARSANPDPGLVLGDVGPAVRPGALALPSSHAQGRHRPQRAGLGPPLRSPMLPIQTPGLGRRLTPLNQKRQTLVCLGSNKKQSVDLGTLLG